MKGIVCDKCGKIVLLEDKKPYEYPCGIYRLIGDSDNIVLDICEDCSKEFFELLRNKA